VDTSAPVHRISEYLPSDSASDSIVQLLHVMGGSYVGKTRLVSEFAGLCGGTCEIVRAREGYEKEIFDSLSNASKRAILVIEATRPHIQFIELIEEIARTQKKNVKVIIVSRTDSWVSFFLSRASDSAAAFVEGAPRLELNTFGGRDDLLRWLLETTSEICKLLDIPEPSPPSVGPSPGVTMMEVTAMAIVGALEGQHLTAGTLSGPEHTIAEIGVHLIRLESKFWLMPGEPFGADATVERRCIWILSAIGVADENDAVAIARRLPDLRDASEATVHSLVRWVKEIYPPSLPDSWTDGPQPDFLLHALSRNVLSEDDWLVDLLQIDLPGNSSLSDAQYAKALRSLAQTASIFPDVTPSFSRMISRTSLAKLPVAISMAIYLDDVGKADQALAQYIISANIGSGSLHPFEAMVDSRFVNVNAAIMKVKVDDAQKANDPVTTAQLLVTLSDRQSLADQYQSAADTADEAVRLYRALSAADPEAHQAHLAAALITWMDSGAYRFESDEIDATMTAAAEAVELYQNLASSNPELYDERFSEATENYGNELRSLDRHDLAKNYYRTALKAAQQAVQHPLRLGQVSINSQRASEARAWLRIGRIAGIFGMDAEERTATRRGVNTFRALFSADPISYRYDLVASLEELYRANISASHTEDNDLRLAACAAEALAIARDGDKSDATVYYSNLCLSFRRVVQEGSESVRLALAEEAVQIYELLDQGDQFFEDHQGALWKLARLRESAGAYAEADQLFRKAIVACRRLCDAGVYGRFERQMTAQAKTKYVLFLKRSERYVEALRISEEVTDLYSDFGSGQEVNDGFTYLFGALTDQEEIFIKLGKAEEARSVRERIVNLHPNLDNALDWPIYSAGDVDVATWFERVAMHHNPAVGLQIAARNAVRRRASKKGDEDLSGTNFLSR
jgi:tetratricopeptide (TPR) repeat protein